MAEETLQERLRKKQEEKQESAVPLCWEVGDGNTETRGVNRNGSVTGRKQQEILHRAC